ncbi:HEPN domain-containing protein [Stenotrophomonas pictorum]|uniref:HEPN domain-containing protein n=1 Tax=Stenotrophomonas pictorum TaxID=86184 RepID=UPI000AEDA5C6|nr:HEPN domain-containing protein [Stenotrophomonas pictorum]
MPISWKKTNRFKPTPILQRIAEKRTINDKGGASFSGLELQQHIGVLHSMLDFPAVCEPFDKTNLIWTALSNAKPEITPASFIQAINNSLTTSLSKKSEKYVLVTSISTPSLTRTESIKVISNKIRFHHSGLPKKFASHKEILDKNKRIENSIEEPSSYTPISIEVLAKSEAEAANRGLYEIDLLRGLWCMFVNPYMQVSLFSSGRGPINSIRLGNCHTLHKKSGESASTMNWFEHNYSPVRIFKPKPDSQYGRHTRIILNRLSRTKYKNPICDSIVSYARALDEPDPSSAFLRLWTSLESLVTPYQANYDLLVKRCSFLFTDHEYQQQILEHLREFRNSVVHTSKEQIEARTNCFHLQTFFRSLVFFLINNGNYFRSLSEAHDYLDLPNDHGAIVSRIKLLTKAKRFTSPIET